MRTKAKYLPPSLLTDGTRDISLNLKGRILQSLLEKNNSGNSIRRNLFRWWVRCHKEYISLSVKKIPITARISPEIAIYRMRYIIDKMRYERRKVYNERRIRLFVAKMEKVCDPVPMRHKAYAMRVLLSKDPRHNILNRLILSQKCKETEAFHNLRENNRFFIESMIQRNELILLEDSLKILVDKARNHVQDIMLDSIRVKRQQAADDFVDTQVLK